MTTSRHAISAAETDPRMQATEFGWPSPRDDTGDFGRRPLERRLWIAVAVLGSTVSVLGMIAPSAPLLATRLAVFAAVVAALGVLSGRAGHGWLVVATAVTGLFDALVAVVSPGALSWPVPVVTAVVAAQSAAALVALVIGLREDVRSLAANGDEYEAMQHYVETCRAYAASFYPSSEDAPYTAGDAEGDARAPAGYADGQDPGADLYAQYAGNHCEPRPSVPHLSTRPAPPSGLPGAKFDDTEAVGHPSIHPKFEGNETSAAD